MKNLESITIHQFRGLRDLKLENLGQINLLVGVNNSGKTSVLEAINLYCNPLDIRVWLNIANKRKRPMNIRPNYSTEGIKWLFPCYKNEDQLNGKSIIITSTGKFIFKKLEANYKNIEEIGFFDKRNYRTSMVENIEDLEEYDIRESSNVIQLKVEIYATDNDIIPEKPSKTERFELRNNQKIKINSQTSNVSTLYLSPFSHRAEEFLPHLLSEAKRQNFKPQVIELLQAVDQDISDLEILDSANASLLGFEVYIQHDKLGLIPVSNFGEGIRRLLAIALILPLAKERIILIDEIEASIHTEALQLSFKWLVEWCKKMEIQLFATTHSLEAIDAILEATEPLTDLVFYRLEQKETKTKVIRHNGERLKRLREELGQEVRW